MAFISKHEQRWWDSASASNRAAFFPSQVHEIATELTRAITIPNIKRALGMYSEFFIRRKKEGAPWMAVYDLEHIRHLNPTDIRVMLFVTNLGLSYEETSARLHITRRSARVMAERAWQQLTMQIPENQRVRSHCYRRRRACAILAVA